MKFWIPKGPNRTRHSIVKHARKYDDRVYDAGLMYGRWYVMREGAATIEYTKLVGKKSETAPDSEKPPGIPCGLLDSDCSCDLMCLKYVERQWIKGDHRIYPTSFVEFIGDANDTTKDPEWRCRATGIKWSGHRAVPPFIPDGTDCFHIAVGVHGYVLSPIGGKTND